MRPDHRSPTTPGEIIREEYLEPLNLTQAELAQRLSVTTETINRIVNGKRALTVSMALRLAKAFDTTPEFWMNLQLACDLHEAYRRLKPELKRIKKIA